MESLPKITTTTGAAGKADTRHGDSGASAAGQSFADMLSIAHAAAGQPADRGSANAAAPTSQTSGASNASPDRGARSGGDTTDNTGGTRKGGKVAKDATAGTSGKTDKTVDDKSDTAAPSSTPGTFAVGLAGAMLNTVAPSAAVSTATTLPADAIAGGVAGVGAKSPGGAQPQAGAQAPGDAATQGAGSIDGSGAATAPETKSAGSKLPIDPGLAAKADAATAALVSGTNPKTAADHLRAAIAAATGKSDKSDNSGAATGAAPKAAGAPAPAAATTPATVAATAATQGNNLVLTTDGDPTDPAAAATVAGAVGGGKSTPGKANSLVTGSSEVVTAKTAIRTNAIDPTTTVKDAKPATGPAAAATAASATGAPTPLTADTNAARAPAGPSPAAVNNAAQSGSDSAAARAQHAADLAKADGASTADASAAPDSTTSSSASGTPTNPTAIGGIDSTSGTQHSAASGAARPTAVPVPAPVFDQIAMSVNRAAGDGVDHITIQLKPESLGRVDVHLQLGHDGRMSATFVADRQDTLDMLQRDSRGLERALNDAGLRTDSGGLQFNLRSGGQDYAGLARDMAQASQGNASNATPADTGDGTTTAMTRLGRAIKGLLDISV